MLLDKEGLPGKDAFQLGYSIFSKKRWISPLPLNREKWGSDYCSVIHWNDRLRISVYDCRLQDGKVYANPFQIPECVLLSFHPGDKKYIYIYFFFHYVKSRNTHFGHCVLISHCYKLTSQGLLQLWASASRALDPDLCLLNPPLFYCFKSPKSCEVVVRAPCVFRSAWLCPPS